ncbi:MAG: hypothetical protein ACK4IC_05570 [Erythrobacter sp.]
MTATYRPAGATGKALIRHFNAATLWNLPASSQAPADPAGQFAALAALGVRGFQHPFPAILGSPPMPLVGMGRVDRPEDAARLAQEHKAAGYELTTLHVGTGLESDEEIDALIGAIITASDRHDYPLFVETHRATVTQDIYRTLQLIRRHPEIRFNADLSHYYTGHEMTYGDIARKFDAMEPIFRRVRYMHGRIGTPCCAQVALSGADDDREFVDHFREMWTQAMRGFAETASAGEVLPFAPELLPYELSVGDQTHRFYYARRLNMADDAAEESDRWEQARYLFAIADSCAAEAGLKGSPG